jgi:ADP-ribosylglycohydrolase
MLGAIADDVIGSICEWQNIKSKNFPLFASASFVTDDSVLTVALADARLSGASYAQVMKAYFER